MTAEEKIKQLEDKKLASKKNVENARKADALAQKELNRQIKQLKQEQALKLKKEQDTKAIELGYKLCDLLNINISDFEQTHFDYLQNAVTFYKSSRRFQSSEAQ